MTQHHFTIKAPSRTPFEDVENIALRDEVFPRMQREGKSGYADLMVTGRTSISGEPGMSNFRGSYKM
ncbi:hypothetical protein [Rhodococcus sp. YH1]|uniref:hypothetical protein n=1 Tax=Rhodococcus sp. YH1 TaxID=89066 RepID=UPI001386D7BB|nr:hypothetical protein [Rhodococcus sp. YH1]NCL78790.1 hypothetical protein [Rhodococcus sp. YH1]